MDIKRAFSYCPETAAETQIRTKKSIRSPHSIFKELPVVGTSYLPAGHLKSHHCHSTSPSISSYSTTPPIPHSHPSPTDKPSPLISGKKEWREGREASIEGKCSFLKRDPSLPLPPWGVVVPLRGKGEGLPENH